jgi:hypothetical protein
VSLPLVAPLRPVKRLTPEILFVICVILTCGSLSAQTNVWQPSPGHTQVPIWPGAVPDAQPWTGPESANAVTNPLVAGKPWLLVDNVSQPTMTIYWPKRANTSVAIVVFAHGGG